MIRRAPGEAQVTDLAPEQFRKVARTAYRLGWEAGVAAALDASAGEAAQAAAEPPAARPRHLKAVPARRPPHG